MSSFDPDCRACPRLAAHLDEVKALEPDYHCRPVPPFGDPQPRLLIVGLAPGRDGANRTGRPFTGDHAGILLYEMLYRHGFSNRPESVAREDGLILKGARITNAVKCLPPANRPTAAEVRTCNPWLAEELHALAPGALVLALGRVAHDAVLRACGMKLSACRFAHGAEHVLTGGLRLLDSYHCSRYNTQTGRLTPAMFDAIFRRARALIPDE